MLDDASTDETQDVLARYAGDERFSVRRAEVNVGLFANFNRCLEVGRSDFVKVLCADDWLHPRSVEDALAALDRHPSAGMASSPSWLVDADDRVTGVRGAPFGPGELVASSAALRGHADWGNAAGMPTNVLLRRAVIDEVGGFDAQFAPAGDLHLWLKVLARHDLAWVSEPRCYTRIHGEHAHGYAYAPSEAEFRLWEDMHDREPAAVGGALLARALRREARHHLLYATVSLAQRRGASARGLVRATGRHLPIRAALASFAVHLPGLALGQALRVFAVRSGRLVLYDPAPRPGPRITDTSSRSCGGPRPGRSRGRAG